MLISINVVEVEVDDDVLLVLVVVGGTVVEVELEVLEVL
jgi:hypothetical protein